MTGIEKADKIRNQKGVKPVSCLTGYDYATGRLLDEAGVDLILVGDSLGMVVEGGVKQVEKVRAIVEAGIPVFGHMGMLPQRVVEEGGYKKKGKSEDETDAILEGCLAKITKALNIPTIGIGCGEANCDGEIAVITDVVGAYPWFVPPFATVRANVASDVKSAAIALYFIYEEPNF